MRKKYLFGVAMLTGCGANFQISASDLEKYSEDNSAVFSDVSNSYTEAYNYLVMDYMLWKKMMYISNYGI